MASADKVPMLEEGHRKLSEDLKRLKGERPEIVEAIEGPLGVTECSGEHSTCEIESHCGVRGNWRRINDVVADALRGITLAQMRGKPAPAPAQSKRISLRLAGA